jgi:hypothetical protein
MNKYVFDGANQLLKTTQKHNVQKNNFLSKKLNDQRKQLICEEQSRKNLLLKKLNMIRQNIIKAQQKASSQARIAFKHNMQKIGFKNQIKTQKMYFDLFESNSMKNVQKKKFNFNSNTQNLTQFINDKIKSSKRSITTPFQSNRKKSNKSKKLSALPRLNSIKLYMGQLRQSGSMLSHKKSASYLLSNPSRTIANDLTLQSKKSMKQNIVKFIKSHVNASNLISFSVSYELHKRQSLKFLHYLKSLPNICHFFLSRIHAKEVPVNVNIRGVKKLYDLRKVHEILNSLQNTKKIDRSKGLCQMYDENLNLIQN